MCFTLKKWEEIIWHIILWECRKMENCQVILLGSLGTARSLPGGISCEGWAHFCGVLLRNLKSLLRPWWSAFSVSFWMPALYPLLWSSQGSQWNLFKCLQSPQTPAQPHEVMLRNCRMSNVVGIPSLPLEPRILLPPLTQDQAYLWLSTRATYVVFIKWKPRGPVFKWSRKMHRSLSMSHFCNIPGSPANHNATEALHSLCYRLIMSRWLKRALHSFIAFSVLSRI